jgi:hypothetical protein
MKCGTCGHPDEKHGAPFSTDATCQVEGCECFGFHDAPNGTQIAADDADFHLYRMQCRLDGMAAMHHEPDFKHAADALKAVRAIVRKHMHRHDLAKSHG